MRDRRFIGSIVMAALVVLTLVVTTGGSVQAGEGEQPQKKVKKVKILKTGEGHACQGADCPEARHHHRVIVEKDGKKHEIHQHAGEDCAGDCVEKIIIKRIGAGDEVHAMADAHVVIGGEECEGDDCGEIHRIIVEKSGDPSVIHGVMEHEFEWTDDDCEGEDCKKRRIIIKGHGDHHGSGGHGFAFFGEGEGKDHFRWVSDHKGGFLGIQLTELTAELRTHFGAPADQGVMVGKVLTGSAAESAGVEVGDIVTTVGSEPVGSPAALSRAIGTMEAGASVDLGIWRNGAPHNLTAVLGERKAAGEHGMRKIIVRCEDGDEECGADFDIEGIGFDCGGAERCEVKVECEDDECTCTANGESIDCEDLDLPHLPSNE